MQKDFKTGLFSAPEQPAPFISDAWQQHAELIMHLSQFSQNVLVAVAPQQGGKTTFARHLQDLASDNLQKILLTAEKESSLEELLRELLAGLGVQNCALEEASDRIRASISESYQQNNKTWLLIIDDAHLLSDEQLQAFLHLIHFEAAPCEQLHLVLIGEPSLELRLFSTEFSALADGKIYTIELESWTLKDLSYYFAHHTEFPNLSSEQIALIFEKSRGLPGYVKCEQQALQYQDTVTTSKLLKYDITSWKKSPIFIGVLASIILGSGYLLFNGQVEEEIISSPLNVAMTEKKRQQELPLPPKEDTILLHFNNSPEASNNEARQGFLAKEQAKETEEASNEKNNEVPVIAKEASELSTVVSSKTLSVVAKTVKESKEENKNNAVSKVTKVESPKTKDVSNPQASKVAANRQLTTEEAYFLSANQHHYTVQLLGAHKEESVKQFISQHTTGEKIHYYRTKLGGKDWFVVVYGDYSSREAAKVALSTMPASIKKEALNPWVRDLKSIQEDIKQRQG